MLRILKNLILYSLNKVGYQLVRKSPHKREIEGGEEEINKYIELFGEEATVSRRFYNIGAGKFRHPVWTNIDHYSDRYARNAEYIDIDWDISSKTPIHIPSETASLVYCSHTIEHLFDDDVSHLFSEVYRILECGGFFRVTCPDIDLYYWAYLTGDISRFPYQVFYESRSLEHNFLAEFTGQLAFLKGEEPEELRPEKVAEIFRTLPKEDALNYFTEKCDRVRHSERPSNHCNWWNSKKIEEYLRASGFTKIFRSGFSQSQVPVFRNPHFFDLRYPGLSVYVEAQK